MQKNALHNWDRRQLLLSAIALAATACSKEDASQAPGAAGAAKPADDAAVATRAVDDPDLLAEAMLLPGLVNSSTDGPMIELLQAIARQYTGGKISITAAPVGRVNTDMKSGAADLALAFIRLRPDADAKLSYRYSSTGYGQVSFVLYSRKSKPVHARDIRQAEAKAHGKVDSAFPWVVESALFDWGFPVISFTDMASAFKKLEAGHIDAFLWAQEEADAELRKLGFKDIARELFGSFDDVLAIQRGPRGDKVDQMLTQAITALRASGELQKIYSKIHLPYDPWQP